MDLAGFSSEMQARGCVGNGRNFCGSYNGYPFTAVYGAGKAGRSTSFTISLFFGYSVRLPALQKAVREEAKAKGLPKVQVVAPNKQNPAVSTAADDSDFARVFDGVLAAFVAAAMQLGYTVPTKCPLCGAPGCDSYAYINTAYQPAHAMCVNNMAATSQTEAQKNKESGSYLLGVIGAILGALVGTIPSILLAALGFVSAWTGMLVPLGAYYGYKLLNGKQTKAMVAVVIVAALLMIPVIDYAGTAVYLLVKESYSLSVSYYLYAMKDNFTAFITDYLMTLFFTGLGTAFVWSIITRTVGSNVRDADFSRATLRPINPGAPAPAPAPGYIPPAIDNLV